MMLNGSALVLAAIRVQRPLVVAAPAHANERIERQTLAVAALGFAHHEALKASAPQLDGKRQRRQNVQHFIVDLPADLLTRESIE